MAEAQFLLGANYHPIDRERQSWGEWYANDPGEDFSAMAEMGMSIVRVFFSWRMFEPQVGQYDDDTFERLDRLIAAAKRNGLMLVVALFDDDGVSELMSHPWRQGRSIVSDEYMLQRATQMAQRVGMRYRGEKAVLAWDLLGAAVATELGSAARFAKWFDSVSEALREGGAEQMVTVGVDAEALMEATKVRIDDRLSEAGFRFAGAGTEVAAYVTGDPEAGSRATYLDSFLVKLARRGVPVIAYQVGVDSLDETVEHEAARLRVSLGSLFLNRAGGALVRRWRDLDADWRDPYSRLPNESPVGVRYPDDTERPSADEVRGMAEVMAAIDLDGFSWERERAAILMPEERYAAESTLASLTVPRSVYASFVTARQSHIPTDVIVEADDPDPYPLVIAPSVARIDEGTWPKLTAFVDGGGTLLLSYGGGDVTQAFCELFGLEFMGDLGRRSELATKPSQESVLGTLPATEAEVELPHFALVSTSGAGIVATDTKGNPLVTAHSRGQGKAIFCAAPLERALTEAGGRGAPTEIARYARLMYSGVARLAQAHGAYDCDAPELEVGVLHSADGSTDIFFMVNHESYDVDATVTSERAVASVADLVSGRSASVGAREFVVPVGPHRMKALRLELEERRRGG